MMHPPRSSRAKNVHELVIAGFYDYDLDADDVAFLEHVRLRGTANGALSGDRELVSSALDLEPHRTVRHLKFGQTVDRHFVPQWKLDDARAVLLAARSVIW